MYVSEHEQRSPQASYVKGMGQRDRQGAVKIFALISINITSIKVPLLLDPVSTKTLQYCMS